MRTRSRGKTQKEDSIVVDLSGGGVLLGRKTIRDMGGNKSILKENINGSGGSVTKNYLKYNHIQPPKIQNLNRPNNPIHPKMHSEVFNESFVDSLMYWKHPNHTQPGSGLKNLGNTCFLNSVLQCILYTVPLKNYFNDSDHSQMCKLKGVCFICEYGRLSKLVEAKKTAIIPQNIIQNIRNIAHHIKIGRQEDAHEFLIYFLAAMENSSIVYLQTLSQKYTQRNSFDTFFDENNLIQKIFGGILVSTVTCKSCKRASKKFDKFIDISLEISNSENILNCFEHFCKPENLTGNNKYFCDNCHKQNDSVKKLNFEKFPRILVVHLKRFDNRQRKIRKFINFDKEIDLNQFTLNKEKEKVSYRLNSILVHEGGSINSGHYYSFVRISDSDWYLFNDHSVVKVDEKRVMSQTPYLLFYEKIVDNKRLGTPKKPLRDDSNFIIDLSNSHKVNKSDKKSKTILSSNTSHNYNQTRILRSKRNSNI